MCTLGKPNCNGEVFMLTGENSNDHFILDSHSSGSGQQHFFTHCHIRYSPDNVSKGNTSR